MKVFISWSGPQSKYIALTLQEWLPNVIQNLNVWVSALNIEAGQRWTGELFKELQDSQFGVVCLTAENLHASWLHFEAGALAKMVEGRVCPYLYQLPGVFHGPLSQFQWKQVDKQGTKELLQSINSTLLGTTQKGISLKDFDKVFETWWPHLEEKLKTVPPSIATAPQRDMQEIVEELLDIVRDQARKLLITEGGSTADRAWNKIMQHTRIKGEITNMKLGPEDLARIREKIDSMRLALSLFTVAPSEEPASSDTPQGEKPPSK